MKEIGEHEHTGSNIEEWTHDLKGPHHRSTVLMKLGKDHVQVPQYGNLEGVQQKGQVQDLEHAVIDVEEGWITWISAHEWELVLPASLDSHLAGVAWLGQLKLVLQSLDTH